MDAALSVSTNNVGASELDETVDVGSSLDKEAQGEIPLTAAVSDTLSEQKNGSTWLSKLKEKSSRIPAHLADRFDAALAQMK